MKKIVVLFFIAIFLCPTYAGEIYGSIKAGGKSVGPDVKVEIIAPDNTLYTKNTDKYGSYSIYVKLKGKCVLKVHYNQQIPSTEVYSYDSSTRYNFALEIINGKYVLRRD